jgi:hypothetical protein
MESRTRPRPRPDPDVAALRAIRKATRDYLTVLDHALAALTDDAVASKPELAYLRSALAIATGKRGSGGVSFGTPVQLEGMLSRLLGEEET